MRVADEVWVSTALLHAEHPDRMEFAVEEIKARARQEKWPIRPGFGVHASYHCLANKPANPADHRMLYEGSRGRKRLFREGDPCHPDRQNGKIRPNKQDLPAEYQNLVDWYDAIYTRQSPDPTKDSQSIPVARTHDTTTQRPSSQENLPVSDAAFVGSAGALVIPEGLRKELGIREGTRIGIYRDNDRLILQPVTEKYIASLAGCCKGGASMVEAREREHRMEK